MEFTLKDGTIISLKDKLSAREFMTMKLPNFNLKELSKIEIKDDEVDLSQIEELKPMLGWLLDLFTTMGWNAWDDDLNKPIELVKEKGFEEWIQKIFIG
jgi:hypothetical protein